MTHAPVRSSSRRFASAHGGSTVWGHRTGTEPRTGGGRKVSAEVSVRSDVSDSSKGRRDRIHLVPLRGISCSASVGGRPFPC